MKLVQLARKPHICACTPVHLDGRDFFPISHFSAAYTISQPTLRAWAGSKFEQLSDDEALEFGLHFEPFHGARGRWYLTFGAFRALLKEKRAMTCV